MLLVLKRNAESPYADFPTKSHFDWSENPVLVLWSQIVQNKSSVQSTSVYLAGFSPYPQVQRDGYFCHRFHYFHDRFTWCFQTSRPHLADGDQSRHEADHESLYRFEHPCILQDFHLIRNRFIINNQIDIVIHDPLHVSIGHHRRDADDWFGNIR